MESLGEDFVDTLTVEEKKERKKLREGEQVGTMTRAAFKQRWVARRHEVKEKKKAAAPPPKKNINTSP